MKHNKRHNGQIHKGISTFYVVISFVVLLIVYGSSFYLFDEKTSIPTIVQVIIGALHVYI